MRDEERARFVPTKNFIAFFGNWFHRLVLVGSIALAASLVQIHELR